MFSGYNLRVLRVFKGLLTQRKRASSQQERAEITKVYNKVNNRVKYQIQQFEEEERKALASDICNAKDKQNVEAF